jgi:DMSO/TMAO reductase YedYZ molybdopterin-dependent catalytic subunit
MSGTLTRRQFLAGAALLPALQGPRAPAGALLGTIPFVRAGNAPLDRRLGDGLDARLFTDLSTLTADRLVMTADRFFIRTAAPSALPPTAAWTLGVGGLVREPLTLSLDALAGMSRPAGRLLVECAGNSNTAGFGLMGAADWEGVPLQAVLDRVQPSAAPHRILVSGVDDETTESRTSLPGASWIFSRDDVQHAVLALRMNGAPLPLDHGAPVRLVVPNWYGCACIKWVDRVDLVPDDAPATSQMSEYAARTHQIGPPSLARDYTPAIVDTAATPVRVERWNVDGKIAYRVVGVIWGGARPTNALAIRFRANEAWVPVDDCPMPASTLTWSVWSHMWRPASPGRYQIVVRVADPSIRTRRLDLFFYVREVEIPSA